MPSDKIEVSTTPYRCSLVSQEVSIEDERLVRTSRSGEQISIPRGMRCSHMNECPVATHSPNGNSTSYEWSKCEFRARRTPQ
jgi:hypothetical protein